MRLGKFQEIVFHHRGKFRKKINKHKNKGCLIYHLIMISQIGLTAENDFSGRRERKFESPSALLTAAFRGRILGIKFPWDTFSLRVPQLEVEGK